ncbi:MAG: hypothetical protein H8E40_05170 [Chloroflexi bacterium]|nr:hypothetical protein [Chloroflexota bacterium]
MAKADINQTPEDQFLERLNQHGYEVTRDAKVKGGSGTEHTFAMMANKDDGFFQLQCCHWLIYQPARRGGTGCYNKFR